MLASSPAHGRKETTMPHNSVDYAAWPTGITVEPVHEVGIIRLSA
jgi:hypothetical protein